MRARVGAWRCSSTTSLSSFWVSRPPEYLSHRPRSGGWPWLRASCVARPRIRPSSSCCRALRSTCGSAPPGQRARSRPRQAGTWRVYRSSRQPRAGRPGGVIGIESLADYLGLDVTVVGLVMATGVGEVTIVDDTGEVRIGGPSAAEALSLLEPGDAVEARGRVTQDERGLLIQADAASIVILPGGEAAASRSPGSVVGLLAGNEAASILPGPRSASSIR